MVRSGIRQVQATVAKARLAELLRAVEHGERVAITRHGRTIAHLIPAEDQEREARREAVRRFNAWLDSWGGIDMSLEEALEYQHAGHRY